MEGGIYLIAKIKIKMDYHPLIGGYLIVHREGEYSVAKSLSPVYLLQRISVIIISFNPQTAAGSSAIITADADKLRDKFQTVLIKSFNMKSILDFKCSHVTSC